MTNASRIKVKPENWCLLLLLDGREEGGQKAAKEQGVFPGMPYRYKNLSDVIIEMAKALLTNIDHGDCTKNSLC